MSVIGSNVLAGASGSAGAAGYEIERSLRFNSADSAYLNRTPSSAGNRKTWTWSGWVKRSGLSRSYDELFGNAGAGSAASTIFFNSDNVLIFQAQSGTYQVVTDQVFRDTSAWYHIVAVADTTNATSTDRLRLYVNGSRISSFSSTAYPTQNFDTFINQSGVAHYLGRMFTNTYFNGYLADIHFIDGQALAPTDFGEFDDNNVWQPKEFTGSYASDPLYSSYATNPSSFNGSAHNLFDGDLTTSWQNTDTSGSTYASVDLTQGGAVSGIAFTTSFEMYGAFSYNQVLEIDHAGGTHTYNGNPGGSGAWIDFASSLTSPVTAIRFKDSGGTGTPSWNAIRVDNTILTEFGVNSFHLDFSDNSSNAALGYDAAVDAPTLNPKGGMDVVTYTGNGSTQSISGLGFQPDLLWIKSRSTAYSHRLFDRVRGTDALYPDITDAEGNNSINENLISYNSDGFTVGSTSGVNALNNNGTTFVAWAWKAGGAAVSNTDGTVTSQVSASTDYGFSVASFTPASSGAFTIGHGLGVAPSFVIVKARNRSVSWFVYHNAIASPLDKFTVLNSSSAVDSSYSDFWGTSAFSSTVFGMNTGVSCLSSDDMIAYCWSEVSGFSKFGSYIGNGSADGPTVTTGFKPAWIMVKCTEDIAGDVEQWVIKDVRRSTGNVATKNLYANLSNAEDDSSAAAITILPNGFKLSGTYAGINGSATYIYAAFADRPGNYWDVNNLVAAAGAGNDSLVDSPTNGTQTDTGAGGEVVGNYCTWNPLAKSSTASTFSNGNLDITTPGSGGGNVFGTFAIPTYGKWYWEVTYVSGSTAMIGISPYSPTANNQSVTGAIFYYDDGRKFISGTASSYGASYTTNDVIGVAVDADASSITFYKNNTSQGSISISTTETIFPSLTDGSGSAGDSFATNFGQRAFAYTAPSGFKSLCTTNLPDPTIADGSTAMDVALYTGNGSTQTISGLGFSPDLVWMKARSIAYNHTLIDSVRGATKTLSSSMTVQEYTEPTGPTAFTSDGWSMNGDVTYVGSVNANSQTYVGWAWDGGTSTVSNTDGSITSSVRANASAGFSVITANSLTANTEYSIGHSLNAVPQFIIGKNRAQASQWDTYHVDVGAGQLLRLNSTGAASAAGASDSNFSTTPTSSVFYFKANGTTNNYVFYCFAPVAGYSAFGSYTGNGSADGPFVFTGFRPKFVIIKYSSASGTDWLMYDSERDTYNVVDATLYPNSSTAENNVVALDFTSNGFKIRASTTRINASSGTFIYAAFAEHPFKTARAR